MGTTKEHNMQALDTQSMIGKTEDVVKEELATLGFRCRLVSVNGTPCIVTRDFRSDRYNLSIENGIVVGIKVG